MFMDNGSLLLSSGGAGVHRDILPRCLWWDIQPVVGYDIKLMLYRANVWGVIQDRCWRQYGKQIYITVNARLYGKCR